MKPENYWKQRALVREVEAEIKGLELVTDLMPIYDKALDNIRKEINSVYLKYSDKTGLDVSELSKIIDGADRKEFAKNIAVNMKLRGLKLDEVFDKNYIKRLTRLEALKQQVYWEIQGLAPKIDEKERLAFQKIISESYEVASEDIRYQKGGSTSFGTLDTRTVRKILDSKWEDGNYSTRTFGNIEGFARVASEVLGGGLASGISQEKMSRQLVERFDVAKYDTMRLVRTETNYFRNQAELESMKDNDINYYRYKAILDGRTSDVCEGLSDKIYPVKDAVVGENYPPMHPNPYAKGTKVWTANGFIPIEELRVGDLCWTLPEEGEEPHLSPVVKLYKHHEPLIHFSNNSFDLKVSPTHNLWVKYGKKDGSGKYRFQEAGKVGGDNVMYRGIGNNSTKTADRDLLAFIAFYLGDGCVSGNRITICTQEHHDEIKPILERLNGKVTVLADGRLQFANKELSKIARECGTKCNVKRLPSWIKGLCRDDLRLFIYFYTLCDGNVKKGKEWKGYQFRDSITFFTTSKGLSDDLCEVILRAGYRPSVRIQKPTVATKKDGSIIKSNYDLYVISVGYRLHSWVASMKKEMLKPQDCYCVELADTHTLLVMSNGKVVWCGNCRSYPEIVFDSEAMREKIESSFDFNEVYEANIGGLVSDGWKRNP